MWGLNEKGFTSIYVVVFLEITTADIDCTATSQLLKTNPLEAGARVGPRTAEFARAVNSETQPLVGPLLS